MTDLGDMDLAGFGRLFSGLGGGGDRGNTFPQSDAADLSNGARFIPGEVTLARREGKVVKFIHDCSPCCWYWEFSDGTRIYHWDRPTFESIGHTNHGAGFSDSEAGPCPNCGNVNTNGGTVIADHDNPKSPEVTNTTNNPVDAMGGMVPASVGIPAMESRGQQELVNSAQLPVQGSDDTEIIAMGITFGDITPGDNLFREAILPDGWNKVTSDHPMWSYVVDAEGNRRIAIFYKAAFYDRDAFMRLA